MMLGTSTLEKAGLQLGDIGAPLGQYATGLGVVARCVPEFGDTGRLGNGVFLTYASLQKLLPQAQQNVFFVRFRSGSMSGPTSANRRALDPVPTRHRTAAQAPGARGRHRASDGARRSCVLAAATSCTRC
jgi:hypothetical protein